MPSYDTKPDIYAHVKGGKDWKKRSTCRLLVSVGRPYHEEEKLDATINWINQNFEKSVICVGDIAHRHNYVAEGFSPEEAKAISEHDGDLWLQRNKGKLQNLDIPYNVIRWEHWLQHEDFPGRLEKLNRLFKENPFFEAAIHDDRPFYPEPEKQRFCTP